MTSAITMDDKFDAFSSTLSYFFDVAFPEKRVRIRNRQLNAKVVLDENLLQKRSDLIALHAITKDLPSVDPLRQSYLLLKKEYRACIRSCKSNSVFKFIDKSKSKSKAMWSIIDENVNRKSSKESSCHIGPIIDACGYLREEPFEKANIFNKFFVEIGNKLNAHPDLSAFISNRAHGSPGESLFLYPTDAAEISGIVQSLKVSSSAGSDGISSRLLKGCIDLLVLPLVYLINFSLSSGTFPTSLKTAIVKPLHKKSDPKLCDNYRPISLLSTFSKVFERVVAARLISFFNRYNILLSNQFGFRKEKNTIDAMFCFVDRIVHALDERQKTLGLFVDLSKAFDLVNHSLLLLKLDVMGVRGRAHDWFSSYLSNRKQKVVMDYIDSNRCICKSFSEEMFVKMGVPQGSVLGPILFLVFINNIQTSLGVGELCLFADDTSLLFRAPNLADLEISGFIDSNCLFQWFKENGLVVNTDKTHLLNFSIRDSGTEISQLLLDEREITAADSVNFLGLKLDARLNFQDHINKVAGKLSSCLFALRKLAQFTKSDVLLTLYFGCFYPHLRYAVPIWGYENSRTKSIFRLQKKAIRIIFGLGRRESCRTTFFRNKILTFPCLYIFETLLFFKQNSPSINNNNASSGYSLRPRLEIPVQRHSTAFFQHHLSYNSIRFFNAMPASLKIEMPFVEFKRKLRQFLSEKTFYSVQDYLSK